MPATRGPPGSRRGTASSAPRRTGRGLPAGRSPAAARSAAPARTSRTRRGPIDRCTRRVRRRSRNVPDPGMDPGHVVERLLQTRLLVHGAPLEGVLAPGVGGEQHPALGRRVGRRVVEAPHRQVGDRGAADDAVVLLPDALTDLEDDLGGGVVVELADGAPLLVREGLDGLDRPQHGERHRAHGVVTDRPVAPRLGLVMDHDRAGLLVDGEDLGPQADLAMQLPEEGGGQPIHPADDLLHVHVRLADVLAQDLDDRVVHVGLEEVHDRVVLDGALAPALLDAGTRTARTGRTS